MLDSCASFDVVIVGMGPVGAVTACLLGNAGISVKVVEREAGIFDKPRAIVLDHEALRTLQSCGVSESFFRSFSPHTGTDFRGQHGQLIKLFDPKAPPFELGWPPNVMFVQPELEVALADAMARCPQIATERQFNVTAVSQDDFVAQVHGVNAMGQEKYYSASYVIGADGANSIVRSAAVSEIQDLDFAEWWVVVDAWLIAPADLPKKTTQYCQTRRPATFVVGPRNLRRWEIKLLPGEDPDSFRDEDAIIRLLADFVDVKALDIWRSAVYRFRAAVAERWRDRRLLIAGDAAHTMPPFLAQGLCAGIRDAANLSWKLSQVFKHGANTRLLDTYEEERKPHVTEIVRHAKEFGLIIGELDACRAEERDRILEQQLLDGSVPTERQAFIPALKGQMFHSNCQLAGTVFIQPTVADEHQDLVLMDYVVSPYFVILGTDEIINEIDEDLMRLWEYIGGRIFNCGANSGSSKKAKPLFDQFDVVQKWLMHNDVKAVIVRPDRYIFGTANSTNELSKLVNGLLSALSQSVSKMDEQRISAA